MTDVGLRLAIAQEVPDELEIRIDNIAENIVRVFLKGTKTSVDKFYKHLQKVKLGNAEHYTFSEVKPVTEAGCFQVSSDRFFHKLQCEQLGKFVVVGMLMQQDISSMKTSVDNLTSAIQKLTETLDKAFTTPK